jgi:hypothetical protein
MKPRIDVITLAVADFDRALAFSTAATTRTLPVQ